MWENVVFQTVLSGVLVYILSQMVLEILIKPINKYNSLKERIIYTISMYSCYYCNPYNVFNESSNARNKEEYNSASNEIRKIGSELAGYIGTIPKFRKSKIERLNKVLDSLIGISNGMYVLKDFNTVKENKKCENIIKTELKMN